MKQLIKKAIKFCKEYHNDYMLSIFENMLTQKKLSQADIDLVNYFLDEKKGK